ncbi:DNA-binding protein [Saccharata proteae CBS 121410]|uniref:DNA-binding protein n=1 Tax=Saccharata proteae CBS 121410 TaxID=1314787 RepID=A0A6A5YD74_9PEZI|nr:DNA-binding protein [Saccharata proteae CBS 121410]
MPPPIASKQRKSAKATPSAAKPTVQAEPTKALQLISQRQSTDVVQTLLHGSISCLSYVRNLFPESCFDDQVYDNSNDPWSYEEYAAGRGTSKEGTKMKVLRRGRSEAVDQLLDWLEKGAFEALKLNILRAIQLNVLEDAMEPSKVVETYTFTFNYLRSPQTGVQTLTGLQVQCPRGKAVTVKNAKYALQAFIRRLMSFCATLPNLPERRFISMHLFYMPECDQSYQPFGFHDNFSDFLTYPNSSDLGWTRSVQEGGMVDAGYHTAGLRVSYLEQANIKESLESDRNLQIPAGLDYNEVVAREDDIDTTTIFELPPDPLVLESGLIEDQPSSAACVTSGTSKVSNVNVDTYNAPIGIVPESHPDSVATGEAAASNPQQESRNSATLTREPVANGFSQAAPKLRSKIRKSIQHANTNGSGGASPSENPQTQSSSPDSQVRTQLREMLQDSQTVPDSGDTQPAHPQVPIGNSHTLKLPSLQLSKNKLSELLDRHKSLVLHRTPGPRKNQDEDILDCQCGCNNEEDDMINCSFCETWQHLHCYGYRGVDDPRIPSTHACYRCLLEDKEVPLLHELKNLALLRRGIHVIQDNGFSDEQKFAETLHCDLQTAAGVFRHLRSKGLVFVPPIYGHEVTMSETAATLPPLPLIEASSQLLEKPSPTNKFDAFVKNSVVPQTRQKKARLEPRQEGTEDRESRGSARYSLRHRRSPTKEIAPKQAEASGSVSTSMSQLKGKRKSDTSDETAGNSQLREKRFKSSVSTGLISVGHEGSPGPSATTTEVI